MVRSPAEGSIDGLLEDDQQGSGEALRGIREERAPTSELFKKGLSACLLETPRTSESPSLVHSPRTPRSRGTKFGMI